MISIMPYPRASLDPSLSPPIIRTTQFARNIHFQLLQRRTDSNFNAVILPLPTCPPAAHRPAITTKKDEIYERERERDREHSHADDRDFEEDVEYRRRKSEPLAEGYGAT